MSEKLTNKISCAACESAIIAGNIADDPAIQEHLQSCPACREFALFQQTLLAVPPVVKNDLPEFEVIMQKVHAEKARSRRNLRLITWPLSLAAAAALAVGGIVFQLPTAEKNISAPVENYLWEDSEILAAAWDESTVQLAWIRPRLLKTAPSARWRRPGRVLKSGVLKYSTLIMRIIESEKNYFLCCFGTLSDWRSWCR